MRAKLTDRDPNTYFGYVVEYLCEAGWASHIAMAMAENQLDTINECFENGDHAQETAKLVTILERELDHHLRYGGL